MTSMKIYIQTRGKARDYIFLGDTPQKWWRQPVYEQGTSFEKSTLIVEGYVNTWRCYISGIPSNRRDRVNTPIRYTLVLEGEKKSAVETAKVQPLVAAALKAFSTPHCDLQQVLDEYFDFDVDKFIDKHEGRNIEELLTRVTNDERLKHQPDNTNIRAFFIKIEELLSKKKEGSAALLNLVKSEEYVNSEIRPVFKYACIRQLSLLDPSLSGRMFKDLVATSDDAPAVAASSQIVDGKDGGQKKSPLAPTGQKTLGIKNNPWVIRTTIAILALVILALTIKENIKHGTKANALAPNDQTLTTNKSVENDTGANALAPNDQTLTTNKSAENDIRANASAPNARKVPATR